MELSREKYGSFDVEVYVKKRFGECDNGVSDFLLGHLARFYKTVSGSNLKILDYGCGPSLAYSISAAAKASEIVLADFAQPNREFVKRWVDGHPAAYDWSPYFKYVVQTLEGGTAEDANQREDDLRRKVKAVVPCDLLKDNFIDEHYKTTYDVVMSFLCLDAAVKDLATYKSGIKKIASLTKESGYLLLFSTLRENCDEDTGFYTMNDVVYSFVVAKKDFIVSTLKESGFVIDSEAYLHVPPSPLTNADGMIFHSARKVL